MSDENVELAGPDLCQGIPASALTEAVPLLGHAQGEPVIVVRRGAELFAVGAVCTHYSGPLAEGLVVGDTVRCPWHHAAFSLRTGEAVRAPGLNAVSCRHVALRDGRVVVGDKIEPIPSSPTRTPRMADLPRAIVIIGGGAAGNAAAEMLRREQFDGKITLLSADDSLPCDRPNLSKNYLAGSAPEEWIALRSPEFYRDQRIDLKLNACVASIDAAKREVQLEDGSHHAWDALLLATGAEPVRLDVPGAKQPHVHVLRTWADSRALIGRETVLMERVLGADIGAFLRQLHEDHGVHFHLGATVAAIGEHRVTLDNGDVLEADLVVVGIGVRPALKLAEQAGLALDRGVSVDRYLATSVAGIYAAGDIARWPDRLSGEPIRVEHWVVAERQGQVAARNMLGQREAFDMVPFFWTEQYDFGLAYVGHAERFDRVDIDGSLAARDCKLSYSRGGKRLAVAVVHRDLEGLRCEVEFERQIAESA